MAKDDVFLSEVVDLAKRFGWLSYHQRPALTKSGEYRTAMSGDVGFPDLSLVHGRRGQLLFVEIKSGICGCDKCPAGRTNGSAVSNDQAGWLDSLRLAGCDAQVWRPNLVKYAAWRLGPKGRPPRIGHSVDVEPHGVIVH